MPDFIDTFAPNLDPSIDDMQKLYDMEVDESSAAVSSRCWIQRDAARALRQGELHLGRRVHSAPAAHAREPPRDLRAGAGLREQAGGRPRQGVHDAAADAHDDVSGVNPVAAGHPAPTRAPLRRGTKAASAALDAATAASAAAASAQRAEGRRPRLRLGHPFKDWHIKDFPTTEYIAPTSRTSPTRPSSPTSRRRAPCCPISRRASREPPSRRTPA